MPAKAGFDLLRIPQPAARRLPSTRSSLSHYALLEVSPGASEQQLRQAFRQLSKRYHPDTTSLPQVEAEQAFQRLQEAYAVLSDPERRRRYDLLLASPPAPVQRSTGESAPARVEEVRRALSGGEWLALVLLALALLLSLGLGVGLAWMRGAELVAWPSWLSNP